MYVWHNDIHTWGLEQTKVMLTLVAVIQCITPYEKGWWFARLPVTPLTSRHNTGASVLVLGSGESLLRHCQSRSRMLAVGDRLRITAVSLSIIYQLSQILSCLTSNPEPKWLVIPKWSRSWSQFINVALYSEYSGPQTDLRLNSELIDQSKQSKAKVCLMSYVFLVFTFKICIL